MPIEPLLGTLPAEWSYTTLAEACAQGGGGIQTGPFGSQLHKSDYVSEGVPSIMPTNIGDNKILTDGIARIRPEDAQRLSRYLVQEGDIVYSRRGDVEKRALIRDHEEGWLCGTGCLRVRLGDSGSNPAYTSYYLGHPAVRAWIVRHAHGATMPNLNTSILGSLPLVVPPRPEQEWIADILGSIDDKIELNRRMSEALESLSRSMFRAWMVDCQEEDHYSRTPLWAQRPLDEIADFLNGAACQRFPPTDQDTSLPVIKIRELRQGITPQSDRVAASITEKWRIQDGDVLFSWSGTLLAKIWTGGEAALNQHLFKVTSEEFPKWFYFHWVLYHLDRFRDIAADKATTMGHIRRHHLSEATCIVPNADSLEKMGRVMEPLLNRQVLCELESRTLAELRDALLPKLISGELRVPEAEQLVSEVA